MELVRIVAQAVSAIAAVVGVLIAFLASRSWSATLKARRSDDLLLAIFDLVGSIGALISAVEKRGVSRDICGQCIDRVYRSHLELEKAHAIARRSFNLSDQAVIDIRILIDKVNEAVQLCYEFEKSSPSESLVDKFFSPEAENLRSNASTLREKIIAEVK